MVNISHVPFNYSYILCMICEGPHHLKMSSASSLCVSSGPTRNLAALPKTRLANTEGNIEKPESHDEMSYSSNNHIHSKKKLLHKFENVKID